MKMIVGERHAQRVHATLAGGIGGHVRLAPAGAGANIDDGAAAARDHMGQHGLAAQINALEVHRDDAVPRLFSRLRHTAERSDGGVVDQRIDAPVTADSVIDDPGDIR